MRNPSLRRQSTISCWYSNLFTWLCSSEAAGSSQYENKVVDFILFLIFRICSYSGDFALDLYLIGDYYQNKCWGYFILTLVFVFLPACVTSYLNWKYYTEKWKVRQEIIDDTNNELRLREKLVVDPPWKFDLRRVFCLSLFSPIARWVHRSYDPFCKFIILYKCD